MRDVCQIEINCFCRTHWGRLCGLAYRRGLNEYDAQDAVQDLFMQLVERDQLIGLLQMPSPDHQAAFLTTRFNWQLMKRHRDQKRLRRGGGLSVVSLSDEGFGHVEPSHDLTPAKELSVAWVNEVIENAFARLSLEMRTESWSSVEANLRGEDLAIAAAQSGAFRIALHRARIRLRLILTRDLLGFIDPRDASAQLFGAIGSICSA